MLVIYLTALVFIISVIVLILVARKLKKFDKEGNYKKSERILNWYFPIIITMTIVSVALGFELASIPTKNSVQQTLNEYNNLSDFVYCSGIDGVEEKIVEMNNKIDENRLYLNNIWTGVWYREEIANLEKLTCIKE